MRSCTVRDIRRMKCRLGLDRSLQLLEQGEGHLDVSLSLKRRYLIKSVNITAKYLIHSVSHRVKDLSLTAVTRLPRLCWHFLFCEA